MIFSDRKRLQMKNHRNAERWELYSRNKEVYKGLTIFIELCILCVDGADKGNALDWIPPLANEFISLLMDAGSPTPPIHAQTGAYTFLLESAAKQLFYMIQNTHLLTAGPSDQDAQQLELQNLVQLAFRNFDFMKRPDATIMPVPADGLLQIYPDGMYEGAYVLLLQAAET
jgi:hypothetical protein